MCIMSQTHGHDSMTYTSQTPLQAAAQHQHHFPLAPLRVLQCVVVCCSEWQCVAVCCSVLQCATVCCSVLQCVAVFCNIMQCVAVCCSVLQCVAACCRKVRLVQHQGHFPLAHLKKEDTLHTRANTSKRGIYVKKSVYVYMPQTSFYMGHKKHVHASNKDQYTYVKRDPYIRPKIPINMNTISRVLSCSDMRNPSKETHVYVKEIYT